MTLNNTIKDTILIVDDIQINRTILREVLHDDYNIIEASGGIEALKILFGDDDTPVQELPTAVLLDIMMPDMDGFQVLDKIKATEETKSIPVLFITAADSEEIESKGLISGAADYITKPFNHEVIRARVDNHINLARYRSMLEHLVDIKTREVTLTYESTLEVLATIIEYRNLESGAHIRRTTLLTEALIRRMVDDDRFRDKLAGENISSIIKASALHDIGKISIPDSILLAPRKLTTEEFDIIKTHTTIGDRIIDSIAKNLPDNDWYLKYAKEICHHHHEKWDGTGYPMGLTQDNIPLSARIVSIVDVYDALTSPRCYKGAFTHDDSMKIILEGKGKHFDPDIVDIVSDVSHEFHRIEMAHRDKLIDD